LLKAAETVKRLKIRLNQANILQMEESRKGNRRRKNEKKFGKWQALDNGGRLYSYEIEGRKSWKARYVKEVDVKERTVRFFQEIYDGFGGLVEIHEKYPVDKGHEKIGGGSTHED